MHCRWVRYSERGVSCKLGPGRDWFKSLPSCAAQWLLVIMVAGYALPAVSETVCIWRPVAGEHVQQVLLCSSPACELPRSIWAATMTTGTLLTRRPWASHIFSVLAATWHFCEDKMGRWTHVHWRKGEIKMKATSHQLPFVYDIWLAFVFIKKNLCRRMQIRSCTDKLQAPS